MLQNFIRTALRNFRRNRLYTALHLAGLTVGFTGFLLLGLYVTDELRFDMLHTKADRIFRLVEERLDADGQTSRIAATSYLAAERGKQELPEIAEVVKIGATGRSNVYVSDPTKAYHEQIWHADPGFGQVFDFQWIAGDRNTALTTPYAAVLSREFARRLFGTDQVAGRNIVIENYSQPFTITGVLQDFPKNSSIHFEIAVSTSTYDANDFMIKAKAGDWTSHNFPTWILLQPDADPAAVEAKLNTLIAANTPPEIPGSHSQLPMRWNGPPRFDEQLTNRHHRLLPIRDIHFKGRNIEGLSDRMANPAYVTVLTLVALFLLGIACINYINLTTARAAGRGKEVGVRKVVGAGQRHMVGQFLTETYLLVITAFLASVGLLQLMLPGFNEFSDKSLTLNTATDPRIWAGAVGAAWLVGLLAGLYPSFYLARLRPALLFRNVLPGTWWEFSLRKGLVIAQFGLSALLMISTGVVWRQMHFLENKDLGFTHDQLVVVDINSWKVRSHFQTIKTGYEQIPGVEAVSVTTRVPGEWKNLPQVAVRNEGAEVGADAKLAWFIGVDEDFLHTYQIPLLSGRSFASDGTDSAAVMLNESAAALLGIKAAAGQWIELPSFAFGGSQNALDQPFKAQVVGIVQDFHFQSLREKIAPLVMSTRQNPIQAIDYFTVRLHAASAQKVLAQLEAVLHQTDPSHMFEWHFLNDQWALFYREDVRREKILSTSAGGAIFIACLGLFGLATFSAERRRKEIGIRKVLGASVSNITALLTRDFLKLVVLAILIAAPLAWWAMHKWLEDFAYRIELHWWMFALAGLATISIALLTVSFQSIKAGLSNPVKSLHSE